MSSSFNLSDLDCPQFVSFTREGFDDREEPEESPEKLRKAPEPEMESDTSNMVSAYEGDASTFVGFESFTSENENVPTPEASTLEISSISAISEYYPVRPGNSGVQGFKRPTSIFTKPKPFKFQTDLRAKDKPAVTEEMGVKDFSKQLRQKIVLKPLENNVTKVKPFKLHETKKRKQGVEEEYIPLAEQISAFHSKTPPRYHVSANKEFQAPAHWSPSHLPPKSPNLQALKRRRVNTALSREQKEEMELKEMRANTFHARPLDPKVFANRTIASVRPKITAARKRMSFELQTSLRAARRLRKRSEKQFQFRARPVPKSVLSGPVDVKEKTVKTTQPKPPKFASDERIEKRKLFDQEIEAKKAKVEASQMLKTPRPAPANTTVYEKKPTQMKPFSFDRSDKQRYLKKEQRIKETIENEQKMHKFKAQLMPSPTKQALPSVSKKPITQIKPFNFELDSRAGKNTTILQEDASTVFKAQPAKVLEKEPFVPVKQSKQNTEICEFSLQTERRAGEWQRLQKMKEAEEQEKAKVMAEQKAREEEIERAEIAAHRRAIVHKAQPVPHFPTPDVKPSEKPLTQPQTPSFKTDARLKRRHEE